MVLVCSMRWVHKLIAFVFNLVSIILLNIWYAIYTQNVNAKHNKTDQVCSTCVTFQFYYCLLTLKLNCVTVIKFNKRFDLIESSRCLSIFDATLTARLNQSIFLFLSMIRTGVSMHLRCKLLHAMKLKLTLILILTLFLIALYTYLPLILMYNFAKISVFYLMYFQILLSTNSKLNLL